ncbi:hypothetical protein ACIQAD_28825 [Streptomyces sp. NPDC088551]|uniref:hypothetical protein n=1 Tax=Streptomyces sp. NPDC088551 TaxID=3365863 RepID=UPI003806000C
MPLPPWRLPWRRQPRRAAPGSGDPRATAGAEAVPGAVPGVVPGAVTDEQAGLEWLCANLPELRSKADRFGWRTELERQLTEVRAGKAATEALRELRLRRDGTRGSGLPADGTWQERPVVERFLCPHGRCPARGRNADATEPRCHLENAPMAAEDGG